MQNTRSRAYNADQIKSVQDWTDFNLQTIMSRFGAVLADTRIAHDPFPDSPPMPISAENTVAHRITTYLGSRIRRSIRAGFQHMAATNSLGNHRPVVIDVGNEADEVDNHTPDFALFEAHLPPGSRPNHLPGDAKPSYKWRSVWRGFETDSIPEKEYRQVLSQVNFYMKQHKARYSFIITDQEFVAVQRINDNGHLLVSEPISWETQGTAQQPRLTLLLAWWYLCMLAADEQQWRLV